MCVHILGLLKHFRAHTLIAEIQRKLKGFAKGESLRLLRTKVNKLFQSYSRLALSRNEKQKCKPFNTEGLEYGK